jgi:hypothetical protein
MQLRRPVFLLSVSRPLTEPRSFTSRKAASAAECLRENCPVPSNVVVKAFARWSCKSRSGRLAESPNLTSVKNMLKKSFSGFESVTGTAIVEKLRTNVYFVSLGLGLCVRSSIVLTLQGQWARNTLLKEGYTTTKKRRSIYLTLTIL